MFCPYIRAVVANLQIAIGRMKSRVRPPLWRAGTTPEVVVRAGNPARLILDTIAREEPDLLIVGPHDKRGVLDALEGTIAEKAVSARKCPVLVVQGSASAAYRNVLLALDGTAGSRLAVRVAERLVLKHGAQATVIHACESSNGAVLQVAGAEAAGVASRMSNVAASAVSDVRASSVAISRRRSP